MWYVRLRTPSRANTWMWRSHHKYPDPAHASHGDQMDDPGKKTNHPSKIMNFPGYERATQEDSSILQGMPWILWAPLRATWGITSISERKCKKLEIPKRILKGLPWLYWWMSWRYPLGTQKYTLTHDSSRKREKNETYLRYETEAGSGESGGGDEDHDNEAMRNQRIFGAKESVKP